MSHIPAVPQLSVSIEEAAKSIGVARSTIYEIVARGDLPSFKLGRRRMILMAELSAFINRVAAEGSR
ncbi:helix-turn-helix domain-containing protein [Pseudomonas putida]|uniref:helix-turn-helix domain-containing protein n=1 Tax=Pseudomonas putida TaxID=303 RepID=UPI00162832B6|nr:helix-turn-helix domain-containing protein [Pseudomonas putida]QNG07208.1 helix-turn-helix domain-containing protein [Pseudomonas putida]HDS1059583.1 helix-turn-helix domain-containing protein [Pseudomonas putida]